MINDLHFFEIDEKLYEENSEMFYSGESIYVIQYNKEEKDFSVSYGVINDINNQDIIYSCNTKLKTEISIIFNLSNNKIIGIYNFSSSYYNKGIFFKKLINEFNEFYKIKKNRNNLLKNIFENEIEISINVNNYKDNKKYIF